METVGEYEYDRKSLLGHGAFAIVYKGCHRKTKLPVAIKCISKKNIGRSNSLLAKEIKILKELHHENIVQLYECEWSAQSYFLVMEFCNGGDLADYLQAKGTLREDTILLFFRQIANAMKAMHGQGILHRDLKPQNLLLSHKATNPKPPDIVIKIADFGFARHLQSNMMAATLCGSPMYMAPEVITSKQYNAKADLWSIGTIIYQCLVGSSPFHANTPQELRNFYEQTRKVEPKIPRGTSASLTDLLRKLLKRNVAERISFAEFFNHEFFCLRNKTSPMPVPHRASNPFMTPNSSNTSDPRSVIVESPQTGIDCSPSEGDPLFLRTSSSSSESEDFVIVSHPFSSSDSLSAKHKEPSIQKPTPNKLIPGSQHCKSPSHGSPVRSAEDAEIAKAQLRDSEVRSPFMQRTAEGAGSPLTVRFSAVSSRRRAGSGSDSDASLHSRPSPIPLPVPTQVENYERFERQLARASNNSYEDNARNLKSRPRSMSPLCADTGSKNRSSPQSVSLVRASLPILHKALKMFGTPPDFPTILENPEHPITPGIKVPGNLKFIIDNKKETLLTRMARAYTAPDLAKLNQLYLDKECDMTRSKSSDELCKMEALLEDKILETKTLGQVANYSLQGEAGARHARTYSDTEEGRFSDSIFELWPSSVVGDEARGYFFYCRLADSICEVAEQHTMLCYDGVPPDLSGSALSSEDDPLQLQTQKQKQCEQLLLYLRSLQVVATAFHTLRNKVKAGSLPATDSVKKAAGELNARYQKFCQLCTKAKEGCDLSEANRVSFVSADKILYLQAMSDCRMAALDEIFEANLRSCAKRYRRALILLNGLSLIVNDNFDRKQLSNYKCGIRHRLQLLENVVP